MVEGGGSRDLKGKVAVVTGAAQGLGRQFAAALAARGAKVLVGDVADVAATVAEIDAAGGAARGTRLDVTDPASVAATVAAALSAFGRIDILVNNAAISGNLKLGPFTDIDSAAWDAVMAVNIRGVFECSKAVVPAMKRQRSGKIINISSGTAIKGSPGLLHYVASKGAVISMTRALARELGDDNICVNCIAPGLTRSENIVANPAWTPETVSRNVASRALKREADPADLIGALLFLASAQSDFITGQTLSVDGGSVMN